MMSLDSVIAYLAHCQRLPSSSDTDPVDRLNHIYTVTLLVAFSIFVTSKQYVGNPIECFCPSEDFDLAKREYAKTYCWLKNTYRINANEPLPKLLSERKDAEINYYQWVHIVLLVTAGMFKLPHLLWHMFGSAVGIDLHQVSAMMASTHLLPADKAQATRRQVVDHLRRWLEANSEPARSKFTRFTRTCARFTNCCFFFAFRRQGQYLSGLYLMVKFLYLVNSVSVFCLMHHLVGDWYHQLGYQLFYWGNSSQFTAPELQFFPKITFCDFEMWQQANVNTYTVQCALPINMVNEKIFAFLWLWLWCVAAANVASCLYWIYRFYFKEADYISLQLMLRSREKLVTQQECREFLENYLRRDGVFVLDVIRKNSNSAVLGDLVVELWKMNTGTIIYI